MSKAGERLMRAAQEMLGAKEGDPGWEAFEREAFTQESQENFSSLVAMIKARRNDQD